MKSEHQKMKHIWWRGFNVWVAALLAVTVFSSSSSRAAAPKCGPRAGQEFFDKLCDPIPWWTVWLDEVAIKRIFLINFQLLKEKKS